ncbi:MAG: Chain length determinant family protein [Myxococcaceae bacterium]|nr:Chain length determinant family protein [Myxococcaceae bacterium]
MSESRSNDARDSDEDNEGPSKLGTPGELLGFFGRAAKRHRKLMWRVCAVGVLGGAFAATFAPPVFDSTCKILVQKSSAMQILSNPHANIQNEAASDTFSSAPNIILRRDNLVAVIEETKLWDRWVANRPPLFGLKDKIMQGVFGEMTDEMKQRVLISILEKKVYISPDEGSILKIRVEWQDADTAFALVSAFEQRFLADKSTSEASVTSEAIAILEEESKRSAQGIDTALADLLKVSDKVKTAQRPRLPPALVPSPTAPRNAAAAAAPEQPAAPTVNVAALLAEKRAAIRAVRDPWQQRLADLRAQMASLRATYTEQHPQVVTLQSQITAASVKPAELVALEEDERKLLADLAVQAAPPAPVIAPRPVYRPVAPTASATDATATAPAPAPTGPQLTWDGTTLAVGEAPEIVAARERLTQATRKYEDVAVRLDTARIQLQSLQAAFKYRFIVVQPPEAPRKPTKPNRLLLLLAGIAGGIVFGLLGGGIKDLWRGRFIEAWQVERRLRLPLLAEVKVDVDAPEP